MPRHLISDAHEWINEIPTVPIYYLAKPQPRERAWQNQRGKKTLSKTQRGRKLPRRLVQRSSPVGGRGRDNLERGSLRALRGAYGDPVASRKAAVTRAKVSVRGFAQGLRYVLIAGESLCAGVSAHSTSSSAPPLAV